MSLRSRTYFSTVEQDFATLQSLTRDLSHSSADRGILPTEFTKTGMLEHEGVQLRVTLERMIVTNRPMFYIRTVGIADLSVGARDLDVAFNIFRTALHEMRTRQPELPIFPADETARHFFSLGDFPNM
jgi:hypothetical protein